MATHTKVPKSKQKDAGSKDEYKEILTSNAIRYEELRIEIKALSDEQSECKKEMLSMFGKLGKKSHVFMMGGVKKTAKKQQSESLVIFEDKLKKRLTPNLWKKTQTTVFDQSKLDALVASGEVSAKVIAAVSEIKKNAPYVRIF